MSRSKKRFLKKKRPPLSNTWKELRKKHRVTMAESWRLTEQYLAVTKGKQ